MGCSMHPMVGIYWMVSEHLCGGMAKDMYLEELNAPPFLRLFATLTTLGVKIGKTVEDTWPLRAPSA